MMNFETLIRWCRKWLLTMIVSVVVFFSLLINIVCLTISILNYKRDFFIRWISGILHQSVRISGVQISWCGFNFIIGFQNVFIVNPTTCQKSLFQIEQLDINIDLLYSLFHWKLSPRYLVLSGAQFNVSEIDIKKLLAGKKITDCNGRMSSNLESVENILLWVSKQSNVIAKATNVNYCTFRGSVVSIKNLYVTVSGGTLYHRIIGVGDLSQKIPTRFWFFITVVPNNINLYIKIKNIVFKQLVDSLFLRKYFKNFSISSGKGKIQLWVKFHNGILKSLKSLIVGNHVRLTLKEKCLLSFDCISANLLWKAYVNGWRLLGNHIFFQTVEKGQWLKYNPKIRVIFKNTMHTILKKIRSLFSKDICLLFEKLGYHPRKFKRLYRKTQLFGKLHQFSVLYLTRKEKPYYCLRVTFTDLNFRPWDSLLAGSQLSGSVEITPLRGTLQLKSNVRIDKASKAFFEDSFALKQLDLMTRWYWYSTRWNVAILKLHTID
ncbi:YhdP family protein [Coxiella endosymbiont of Amblyomma americanum]|uniref:YhdP family protein n=1 Tax=Coxiella endosymbiont of Amblyomma americanum TaxID=325775 RepID=UPI0012EB24D2|nr:hypothetical protein [Coxiella endosymbiont of Amblyomma americanum]